MTPFLIATLLSLLIVGGLFKVYRSGDPLLFRKALAGTILFVVLLAAYAAWVSGGKLSRIAADQVELSELRMVEVAGSFRLEGRAANRTADYLVTGLPLRLVVEDCAAGGVCRVVHDEARELRQSIPPGGAVAFRQIYVGDAGPARGERRWRVEAGSPRAERSSRLP